MNLASGHYLGETRQLMNSGGLILTEAIYHSAVFEGWHSHENCHLSLVIDGGNQEERSGGTYECNPGKLLFYHGDEKHRNSHIKYPNRNINLEISPAFLKQYDLKEQAFLKACKARTDAGFMLLKLYGQATAMKYSAPAAATDLLLELLVALPAFHSKAFPRWLSAIREVLNDQWERHWTLAELAGIAGVHPTTVSKHFPYYMGCTIGAYQRKNKIAHAVTMIRHSSMSLTEVAYACGFADQSHFIRVFRGETGLLPKDYQRL